MTDEFKQHFSLKEENFCNTLSCFQPSSVCECQESTLKQFEMSNHLSKSLCVSVCGNYHVSAQTQNIIKCRLLVWAGLHKQIHLIAVNSEELSDSFSLFFKQRLSNQSQLRNHDYAWQACQTLDFSTSWRVVGYMVLFLCFHVFYVHGFSAGEEDDFLSGTGTCNFSLSVLAQYQYQYQYLQDVSENIEH